MVLRLVPVILVLIFTFLGLYLFILHTHSSAMVHESGLYLPPLDKETTFRKQVSGHDLLKLISLQNETIATLERQIMNMKVAIASSRISMDSKITENIPIAEKNNLAEAKAAKKKSSSLLTDMETDCENRYGVTLIEQWSKAEEIWCSDGANSVLKCYPYHQKHKQLDGRGPDLFCEATNFIIDFSKVHGEHSSMKPMLGDQYLHFEQGSLLSSCTKTDKYRPHLFMPHHSIQMQTFHSNAAAAGGDILRVSTPTYLLSRDEDCENSFHSTADFMNMFLVQSVLKLEGAAGSQVMLFDKHPDGPYMELIEKAFSPGGPVIRPSHYRGKKVMFERLIFHLESPAGLIFPKVSRPDPMRCYRTSLFDAYRRFVLQAFNLLNVNPPDIPSVTLSLRHRTPQKNVGRILSNEAEVIAVLKKGNMMTLNVEDTSKLKFSQQLKLIRMTNVLIGVHGAGLMFIMFAADEAVLVEIHPSYRQDRHFRHAARMTGKIYMPMRSPVRETCSGSSDSVTVPLEEFRVVVDGALRIARSFDDGLSECGLECPLGVLALDSKLDPFYSKQGLRKTAPVNTNFPCG